MSKKTLFWTLEGVCIVSLASLILTTLLSPSRVKKEDIVHIPETKSVSGLTCTNAYTVALKYTHQVSQGDIDSVTLYTTTPLATTTYTLFKVVGRGAPYFETKDGVHSLSQSGDVYEFTEQGQVLTQCVPEVSVLREFKNVTIPVEDLVFSFDDGKAETPLAPGSSFVAKAEYATDPYLKDIDGDGDTDAVVVFTFNGGGSGTYYYVSFVYRGDAGVLVATPPLLLGDRVSFEGIDISDGGAYVTYKIRKDGEPFSTAPSVKKSLFVSYDKGIKKLQAVDREHAKVFDVTSMSLEGKKWVWGGSVYKKTKTNVDKDALYTLTFGDDGYLTVATNCYISRIKYSIDQDYIFMENMEHVSKFCDSSSDVGFVENVYKSNHFGFKNDGTLHLLYEMGRGDMMFH